MLTGQGLDPGGFVPGLRALTLIGRALGADKRGRAAYAEMAQSDAFRRPIRWDAASAADFDGLILPGGHRARGMTQYLESPLVQRLAADFFGQGKACSACICQRGAWSSPEPSTRHRPLGSLRPQDHRPHLAP